MHLSPRLTVLAVALGALAAPAAAHAQGTLAVDAGQDSVVATGLPFGSTTLQVTRPDADTSKPVVIGQFKGFAFFGLPFSANTTAPTPLDPGGDCWQAGDLSLSGGLGLTPDILPGDTVSVVGDDLSTTVPADASNAGPGGPIAGCLPLSTWGRNVVVAAAADHGALDVSGQAQPLATGVAVTASDGTATTPAVDAKLAADGSWTATIPAASLAALAHGPLTLNGVYAVPDVATGAPAHIAGAALSADNPALVAQPSTPATATPGAAAKKPAIKLAGLLALKRISLKAARGGKLRASFIVPTGARFVRVSLSRRGHAALLLIVPAAAAGTRQTVPLNGARARKLVRGAYTITVGAGATKTQLGSPVLRGAVTVR